MRRGALGSQHADSPHLQDLLLQRRAPAPKRLVLLLHRPNLCRPHTRVGAGVLPCWGLPPHSADIAVLGGRCAVGAPVGRLPTQAGRESSVRGRAPRQRGHRPKTAGGCRELLGPARPGAQACLRGDQPDATQGITRAARGLGGCYPLGSSERMPRSSRTGSARDTGWKRRTFSCLGAWLGVAERTPAILPARREQGQRTELPPQLPEVPQSSLQAPPPGLQPAGGGCSPGTSPPLPTAPLALTAVSRSFWLYCSTSTMGPTGSSGALGPRSHGAGPSSCRATETGWAASSPGTPLCPVGSPDGTEQPGAAPRAHGPLTPSDPQHVKAGPLGVSLRHRGDEPLTGMPGAPAKSRSSSWASRGLPEECASVPRALRPEENTRAVCVRRGRPRLSPRATGSMFGTRGPCSPSGCPPLLSEGPHGHRRAQTRLQTCLRARPGQLGPGHCLCPPPCGWALPLSHDLCGSDSRPPQRTCWAPGPQAPAPGGCLAGAGQT